MKTKPTIILVGGGGHCKSCIDVIERNEHYDIAGIVDMPDRVGGSVLGYPVIATDEDLAELVKEKHRFLVAVGQVRDVVKRLRLFGKLCELGAELPVIVSPNAYVSPHAELGAGTIVMHCAIVNASAAVGCNCILNSGCLVEHDAQVGDHSHISTHAVVNGNAVIGAESFVGSNAVIVNGAVLLGGSFVKSCTLIKN